MKKKRRLLYEVVCVILIIFSPQFSNAQGDLPEYAPNDYAKMKLPPLDVLFENAKKSAVVELYQVKMEEEASALKTEKRSWLKFFKISTGYQWGRVGITSSFSDENTPLFYQFSGSSQSWYNVGASMSVPLNDLLDRKNRIQRQELKTRATKVEIEKWHDEQKLRIIELYMKANRELSIIKSRIEELTLSEAQYKINENDFRNGLIDISILNRAKGIQSTATEEYEKAKAELSTALLQLEVLSKTKIVGK